MVAALDNLTYTYIFHFWSQREKKLSRALTWTANFKLVATDDKSKSQCDFSFFIIFTFSTTDICQHVQHCNRGTAGAQIKRETWKRQWETSCNLLLTDSCSGGSDVCHARPRCVNSQVGDDLPGTATAAAPAEATSVGAPWVDLAWLALLGRCSSPRCWLLLHRHLPLSHLHPLWSHGLRTEESHWV